MRRTQADVAAEIAPRLARAMMRWRGNLPTYVCFREGRKTYWSSIADLATRPDELPQARQRLVLAAAEAFANFAETGRGLRRGIEAAAYANVIQVFVNEQRGVPTFERLPFPLPEGLLAEGPPAPGG